MSAVFNVDRNARQKDYEHLPAGHVLLTKMFATLQGEMPFAGRFAIFVRLAGCNLGAKESCPFCDTYFALHRGGPIDPEGVLLEADHLRRGRPKFMVLTGGEPLLQQPYALIREFASNGWEVQVETNGYFWDDTFSRLKGVFPDKFHIVVSPKVNARKEYPKFNANLLRDSVCLKVLVEDKPNSPYFGIPQFAHEYANKYDKPVYISPINAYKEKPQPNEIVSFWEPTPLDLKQCAANHKFAGRLAFEFGYRLSIQSHLLAVVE